MLIDYLSKLFKLSIKLVDKKEFEFNGKPFQMRRLFQTMIKLCISTK